MVKRKSSFDLVEKAAKKPKTARTVSKKLDFDSMPSVVDESGTLLVGRGDEVFFQRKKETSTHVCVGEVISVYTDGRHAGTVEIWDETHEECWAFNIHRDMDKVKVRFMGQLPRAPQEPEPAPVVETTKVEEEVSNGTENAEEHTTNNESAEKA